VRRIRGWSSRGLLDLLLVAVLACLSVAVIWKVSSYATIHAHTLAPSGTNKILRAQMAPSHADVKLIERKAEAPPAGHGGGDSCGTGARASKRSSCLEQRGEIS